MQIPWWLAPLLALGILAATASAQSTVVIPNGTATAEGNTSNAFPWGRGGTGLRHQCVYDSSHFTNQNITFPILITGLKWRPNGNVALVTTNFPTSCTVKLSTSPLDQAAVSTTMANNQGPDLMTVFSGPVSWAAQAAQAGPTPFGINIPLTTSFLYDPAAGDLNIECDLPIQVGYVGSTPQLDVHGVAASRIYISTGYPGTGVGIITQNHGVVVEVSYIPAAGAATVTGYGAGCYDRASATFYEQFAASTFDLANTNLTMLPTGNGYVVVPGANAWFTPVAANLALTDNAVTTARPLGFTLNYPGGSTSSVYISSNGFVWAQSNTAHGCCAGDPAALCSLGARWCPLWTDLNPGAGGTVKFDTDPINGAAYVTFTSVPEANLVTNLNTFQIAFFASGQVEYRFQSCTVTGHVTVTGCSPGSTRNPGSVDISASLPILTQPDLFALALGANPRPVIGTNVVLSATRVPAGSPLGAFLLGLTQFNPGIDLTSLGMAGCRQFVSTDASIVFFPVGTSGTMTLGVPNNTVFSGVHLAAQAAAFAAGSNVLGVLTSNGLDLLIGTQ